MTSDIPTPVTSTPSFWAKAAAAWLDLIVYCVPLPVVGIVAAVAIPAAAKAADKGTALGFLAVLYLFVLFGLPGLYTVLFQGFSGKTLGKMAFRLKVVRLDGSPLGLGRASLRYLCSILSLALLGGGFLVSAFRRDRRTLHDLLCGTTVVSSGPPFLPALILVLVLIPLGGAFFAGMVAAIAVPRFAQMMAVSKEAALKSELGALKSAVTVYYADTAGKWPADLHKDLVPKYIDRIPVLKFPRNIHPESDAVEIYPFLKSGYTPNPDLLKDTGHWLYDPATGTLVIDCTHQRLRDKKPYYLMGTE